jgi:subtilisin family serine protease
MTRFSLRGAPVASSGSGIAAPIVAGAVALLLSTFPGATAAAVKSAILPAARRTRLVPPLLDAAGAYQTLSVRKDAAA